MKGREMCNQGRYELMREASVSDSVSERGGRITHACGTNVGRLKESTYYQSERWRMDRAVMCTTFLSCVALLGVSLPSPRQTSL